MIKIPPEIEKLASSPMLKEMEKMANNPSVKPMQKLASSPAVKKMLEIYYSNRLDNSSNSLEPLPAREDGLTSAIVKAIVNMDNNSARAARRSNRIAIISAIIAIIAIVITVILNSNKISNFMSSLF